MVDVVADAQREVDLLRFQPRDLAAQQVDRRRVVATGGAQQLGVTLVAAVDRIGQVEVDDRGLREQGVPLVLEATGRGDVAGRLGLHELLGQDRALVRLVVEERLARDRLVVDVRAPVPRRALPEPSSGRVGVLLRGLETVGRGRPRRRHGRIAGG